MYWGSETFKWSLWHNGGIVEASLHSLWRWSTSKTSSQEHHERLEVSRWIIMHGYQKDLTKMCMHYNNVRNNSLFQSLSDVTTVLKLSPPPSLHLMLGIFKHIWKSMGAKSKENKIIFHEFAIRNNCTCESYWSKILKAMNAVN